jgi:hypothetical protein
MFRIEFYEKASLEYCKIFDYISQNNLFYANKVLSSIDETINVITQFPNI